MGVGGAPELKFIGHNQMQGDSKSPVGQIFHPYDFCDVLAVHGIVRRSERKSHENPHAFVIVLAASDGSKCRLLKHSR